MNIKNLIKLDFYTMKPLLKLAIIVLLIPIMIGIVTYPGEVILTTLTFITFLLSILFSLGEKSNFDKLYGILPIKRKNIILSRYLFSLIIIGIFSIISFILFALVSFISNGNIDWFSGTVYLIISLLVVSFFISIQYPFFFKLEYSKAAFMTIAPYIVFFAIGAPLTNNLMKHKAFRADVMSMLSFFEARHILLIFLGLLIVSTFIFISYFISKTISRECYK